MTGLKVQSLGSLRAQMTHEANDRHLLTPPDRASIRLQPWSGC